MDTVTFQGKPLHLEGKQPVEGQKAPDFTVAANDLSHLRAQGLCWKGACAGQCAVP